MATEIDNRIVYLQFNNAEFEKNVAKTNKSLGELEENLKFKNISTNSLVQFGEEVSNVGLKFDALKTIAVTALATIVSKAVSAGAEIVKSMSVEPIMKGWNKYEKKLEEVQRLMNNVDLGNISDEEKLQIVEKSLAKIETFADETSVSYETLVSSVGDLVASGYGLEDSIRYVEGFAVGAAHAGANVQQVGKAVEGWTRAMNSGAMTRLNWDTFMKSSGQNVKLVKEQLIDYAKELGTVTEIQGQLYAYGQSGSPYKKDKTLNTDKLVNVGHFRESLTEGMWLTDEVMKAYATNYGNYVDEIITYENELGISFVEARKMVDRENTAFYKFSQAAVDAAQQSKTLTDAIQATQVAVSSAWQRNFERIFGQFKDAPRVWGQVGEDLLSIFTDTIYKFEDALEEWGTLGGRDLITNTDPEKGPMGALFNILGSFDMAYKAVKDGIANAIFGTTEYEEVFGKVIYNISEKIQKATQKIADSLYYINEEGERVPTNKYYEIKDIFDSLTTTVKNLFNVVKMISEPVGKIVSNLAGPFVKSIELLSNLINSLFEIVEKTGFFDFLNSKIDNITKFITNFIDKFNLFISKMSSGFKTLSDDLINDNGKLNFNAVKEKIINFGKDIYELIKSIFHNIYELLPDFGKNIIRGIDGILQNVSNINVGGIFNKIGQSFSGLLDRIKNIGKNKDFKDAIKGSEKAVKTISNNIEKTAKKEQKKPSSRAVAFQDLGGIYTVCKELPGSLEEQKALNGIETTSNNLIKTLDYNLNKVDESLDGYSKDKKINININTIADGVFFVIDNIITFIKTLGNKLRELAIELKIFDENTTLIDLVKIASSFLVSLSFEKLSTAIVNFSNSIRDIFSGVNSKLSKEGSAYVLEALSKLLLNFGISFAIFLTSMGIFLKIINFEEILNSESEMMLERFTKILTELGILFGVIATVLSTLLGGMGALASVLKSTNETSAKLTKDGLQYTRKTNATTSMLVSMSIALLAFSASIAVISIVFAVLAKNVKGLDIGTMGLTLSILVAASSFLLGMVAVVLALTKGIVNTTESSDSKKSIKQTSKSMSTILALSVFMLTVGGAIKNIVKSVSILGKMKPEQLAAGLFGITILFSEIILLVLTMSLFERMSKNSTDKATKSLITIAFAMLGIVLAIKILGKMNPEEIDQGIAVVIRLGALIGAFLILANIANSSHGYGEKTKSGFGAFLGIALMLISILIAVKVLSKISYGDLEKSIDAISDIIFRLIGLLIALSVTKTNQQPTVILSIAALLASMGLIVKILSGLSTEELIRGSIGLTIVTSTIAGLLVAMKYLQKETGNINLTTTVSLIGIFSTLTTVLKTLGAIKTQELIKGGLALSIMVALVDSIILCVSKVDSLGQEHFSKNIASLLISFTVTMAIMVAAVIVLGKIMSKDKDVALYGLTSVIALVLSLSLAVAIMSNIKTENLNQATKSLSLLAIAAGVLVSLAVLLALASNLVKDWKNLSAMAVSVALLGGIATALMFALSKMPDINLKALSLKLLEFIAVTVVLLSLVAGVALLTRLIDNSFKDPMMMLAKLAVVSLFMVALISLAALCAAVGAIIPYVLLGEIGVLAMTGLMFLVTALVKNINESIGNELDLVIRKLEVLVIFTASLEALALAASLLGPLVGWVVLGEVALQAFSNKLIPQVIKLVDKINSGLKITDGTEKRIQLVIDLAAKLELLGIGMSALGILSTAIAAGGVILAGVAFELIVGASKFLEYLNKNENIPKNENEINHTLYIIDFLKDLTEKLIILAQSLTGLGIWGALDFIGGLALDSVLLTLVGACEIIVKHKDLFLKAMTAVGEILGSLVGAFTGGVIDQASSSLPVLGENLSKFAKNASTFFNKIKDFKVGAGDGFKSLAEGIVVLLGVGVGEAFSSLVSLMFGFKDENGGSMSALELLAGELEKIGPKIAAFIKSTNGVDKEKVDTAVNAVKSIVEVAQTLPSNSLLSKIVGKKESLGEFASAIGTMGTGLQAFNNITVSSDTLKRNMDILSQFIEETSKITGNDTFVGVQYTSTGEILKELVPSFVSMVQQIASIENIENIQPASIVGIGTAMSSMSDGLLAISQATIKAGRAEAWGEAFKILGPSFSTFISETFKNVDEPSSFATKVLKISQAFEYIGLAFQSLYNAGSADTMSKKSLAFKSGASTLGLGLQEFYDNAMSGSMTINTTTCSNLANELSHLIAVFNEIKPDGGLWQAIIGHPDYANFGIGMGAIGTGLKLFVDEAKDITVSDVSAPLEAISSMSETFDQFKEHGGLLQAILGDNKPEDFAEGMIKVANALSAFVTTTGDISPETVKNANDAISNISSVFNGFGVHGGLVQLFSGDNKPEDFANGLTAIGTALSTYSNTVGTIPDDNLRKMRNLYIRLTELETITELVQAGHPFSILSEYISQFATGINIDALKTNSFLIQSLMTFVQFVSDTLRVEFILMASDLSSEFYKQFGSKLDVHSNYDAKLKLKMCLDNITNYIKSTLKSANYTEIGAYIVQGLANGIKYNQFIVNDAITDLGRKMPKQLTNVLDIKSPSKVFEEIGMYTDMGLAKGISNYSDIVYGQASTLSNNLISTVTSAVYGVNEKLKETAGSEDFTIRPVVDITDFQSQDYKNLINGRDDRLNITRNSTLQNNISEIVNGQVIQNERQLLNTIEQMRQDIQNLGTQMEGMQIVLDGKALVGGIANNMDKKLGDTYKLKTRGGI